MNSREKSAALAKERQKANLEIIKALHKIVERFPDMRFTQLLVNADVLTPVHEGKFGMITGYQNEYGLESKETLARIEGSEIWNLVNSKTPGNDPCGAV